MAIYRKTQGMFAPVSTLNINMADEIKPIKHAWIKTGGTFKKLFDERPRYDDPSPGYEVENATSLTLIKRSGSEGHQILSVSPRPMLPQRHQIANDVDWSYYDYIVVESEEVIPVDAWSTSPTEPSAYGVEYKNGAAYAIRKDGSTFNLNNINFAIRSLKKQYGDYRVVLNWVGGYDCFKPYLHDYSRVYSKQLGLRLRWHSVSLNQYFEYIFTNDAFLLTPL